LNPTQTATIFAPPKLSGSTMGKSVLLPDDSQPNGSTVIDMDFIQKQQMQKNMMINRDQLYQQVF
jgi:hypothetical protein